MAVVGRVLRYSNGHILGCFDAPIGMYLIGMSLIQLCWWDHAISEIKKTCDDSKVKSYQRRKNNLDITRFWSGLSTSFPTCPQRIQAKFLF